MAVVRWEPPAPPDASRRRQGPRWVCSRPVLRRGGARFVLGRGEHCSRWLIGAQDVSLARHRKMRRKAVQKQNSCKRNPGGGTSRQRYAQSLRKGGLAGAGHETALLGSLPGVRRTSPGRWSGSTRGPRMPESRGDAPERSPNFLEKRAATGRMAHPPVCGASVACDGRPSGAMEIGQRRPGGWWQQQFNLNRSGPASMMLACGKATTIDNESKRRKF